jgi:hypothetical protein
LHFNIQRNLRGAKSITFMNPFVNRLQKFIDQYLGQASDMVRCPSDLRVTIIRLWGCASVPVISGPAALPHEDPISCA